MASKLNFRLFLQDQASGSVPTPATTERAPSVVEDDPVDGDRPVVTPEIIDEAVESVLRDLDVPDTEKEVLRKLLANDSSTEFAGNLHMTRAHGKGGGLYKRLARPKLNVSQVLTPQQSAELSAYAAEYDLSFHESENHDHPMAAAMRKVDSDILESMTPAGVSVKDVGADPIHLINTEAQNVHACCPDADLKDPSRGVVRMMRARKIEADKTRSDVARMMAAKFVGRDESFVCGMRAEECTRQALVSRSCHVYDVPLQNWPVIMEKAGAAMHIGVVLFPMAAYEVDSGVMEPTGARYEVDAAQGRLRMGFVGSASWFYDQNWLDFMRYGTDQLIRTDRGCYSYKVIQRRGNSVFFQVLRVQSDLRSPKQYYTIPGVRMVRVEGFELSERRAQPSMVGWSALKPKVHWFPESLWLDMLMQAELDFERGVFTFEKLVKYYRVVTPRNTINGVLVSGGVRVHEDQMVALVTHVGMCAAGHVMLGQRTSKSLISSVMRQRAVVDSALVKRMLLGFWQAMKQTAALATKPFVWLADVVIRSVNTALEAALASWAVEPEVREVPFSELAGSGYMRAHTSWTEPFVGTEDVFRDHVLRHEICDHLRALEDVSSKNPALKEMVGDVMAGSRSVGASELSGDTKVPTLAPEVKVTEVTEEMIAMRKLAIQECLEESLLEEKKIRAECAKVMRNCLDNLGRPMETVLRRRAEEYGQPDLWLIRNGVLVNSTLGLDALECQYSALYTLDTDEYGEHFHTVVDDAYVPVDSSPRREYKRFASGRYSGWALSIERLSVYNGPEIRDTLRAAIDLDHKYIVELRQGPPGCGKTYQLVQAIREGDMAMCPVRESALDTRSKILEKYPTFPDVKDRSRSLDSYLTNYLVRDTRELRANNLQGDEVFMAHSGKWYAVAALTQAEKIVAYGDKEQIPHVARVQCTNLYTRIQANAVVVQYDTYRCPADAVAAWAHIYDYRVRTHSKVRKSLSVLKDARELQVKRKHVLMCMYQADKKELRRLFATQLKSMDLKVITVHEAEGKTYQHVALFRFDTRPRNDTLMLFDKQPYALVAMSRHTESFVYVRPKDMGDLIDKWIAKASDVRAVAAAADIASLGQSIQFK